MNTQDLLNDAYYDVLAGTTAAGTSPTTSNILDMEAAEGVLFIALGAGILGGSVITFQLQEGTRADGVDMANAGNPATYTNNSGGTVAIGAIAVQVYKPKKRYVRAVFTPTVANAGLNGILAIRWTTRQSPSGSLANLLANASNYFV